MSRNSERLCGQDYTVYGGCIVVQVDYYSYGNDLYLF